MPAISGKIWMEDILDVLNLTAVPDGCRLSASDHVDFDDIDVSQSEIDDAASEVEPEQVELNHLAVRDLRDGLRALFEGNLGLARPLLLRALDDHPDAQRAVEELLRTFQTRGSA